MNWEDLKIFLEVARTQRLSTAAISLSIDASTVSRRIHQLEKNLAVRLFERSVEGHYLTAEGESLLKSAQQIELTLQDCVASLQGVDLENVGNVKLGTTEAFGSFFVVPSLADFYVNHPNITIDVLPLPRVVKLSRHEADIAITVGKPRNTSMIVSKLCNYKLRLYACKDYLLTRPINYVEELPNHNWVSYIEAFDFSEQLSYLSDLVPQVSPNFKSSSVIAQYLAVKNNIGIGILPCFMADKDPDLQCLFTEEIEVNREFWLMAHSDSKRIARVQLLWEHLKSVVKEQESLLLGI